MNFTDFEQMFSMGDDSDPLMMLVWIIPIIIFVFYGQQIQLLVTSGEIKKAIKKLDTFSSDSKKELIDFFTNLKLADIDVLNALGVNARKLAEEKYPESKILNEFLKSIKSIS